VKREARLGDVVVSMKNGLYKPASAYSDDGTPCLRMYNIDAGSIVWRDIRRMRVSDAELNEYRLREGDLLVNRVNSRELVGKAAFISSSLEPSVFESKNIRVRLDASKAVPKFINYQLLAGSRRHFAGNAQQVVGMASISQKQLADFPIVLADLDEQHRIVSEIEKQFSRLDEAVANLKRVKANLKHYKAAIFKAAVAGELAPKRSKWQRVELGAVAAVVDPQPSHRTPPVDPRGVPYVGLGDFREDESIDLQNARKVSPSVLEEHRARYRLKVGDFVFGKIGTIGQPVRLPTPFDFALSANVVLIQPDESRIAPRFAFVLMASPQVVAASEKAKSATTQAAFGIKKIRQITLELPSLVEQRDIVAEVDRRLSSARVVEADVDANLKRALALRQAILGRWFPTRATDGLSN